jgi:hypothetical protein
MSFFSFFPFQTIDLRANRLRATMAVSQQVLAVCVCLALVHLAVADLYMHQVKSEEEEGGKEGGQYWKWFLFFPSSVSLSSIESFVAFTSLSMSFHFVTHSTQLNSNQPRGSNNRLNERSANRDNGNRLFDSQNNNRGGYNKGDNTLGGFNNYDQQYHMVSE